MPPALSACALRVTGAGTVNFCREAANLNHKLRHNTAILVSHGCVGDQLPIMLTSAGRAQEPLCWAPRGHAELSQSGKDGITRQDIEAMGS